MTKLEELQKAIEDVAEAGTGMLRKSQMAFDFSAPNPHHVAYTRTNSSGTVSNIAAKGAPKPQEPKTRKEQLGDTTHAIIGKRAISATSLHKINGTHEGAWGTYHHPDGRSYEAVKHQGSWHLTGNYTQYAPAEKPAPKPNATTKHEHYPWGRLTKVDGGGITAIMHPEHQEAVGKLQDGETARFQDEQGILWKVKRDGEHVKLTPPSIYSSKTLVVKHSDLAPERKPSVADQLAELKTPQHGTTFSQRMAYHGKQNGLSHQEIARMSSALHASESAQSAEGHARAHYEHAAAASEATDPVYKRYHEETAEWHKQEAETRQSEKHQQLIDGVHKVGNDLLNNPMLAEHHENIKNKLQGLKANPTAKAAAQVAGDLKLIAGKAETKTKANPKQAAHDLKAELESDDFGMTEKGGNGRVKMHKDGTVSVYDSYFAGGDQALESHKAKWSPGGTYHNYFKDKGYNLEVVGTDKDHDSKVFGVKQGRLGHVAVTLKVSKP